MVRKIYSAGLCALLLWFPLAGHGAAADDARNELARMGITCDRNSFLDQIRKDNARAVKLFLKAGMDANARDDWSDWTALMLAAGAGSTDIVNLLIASGADVNAKESRQGLTALMLAASWAHAETTQALVNARADANVKCDDMCLGTALRAAAWNGHTAIVKALIGAGADVNDSTHDGWTALKIASRNGYAEIAKILIKAGADVNFHVGLTALQFAASRGHEEIVQALKAAGANEECVR